MSEQQQFGIVIGRPPRTLEGRIPTVEDVLTREDLGRWLCARRRAAGDSLYVVAEQLGYTNINYLSNIERGRQTMPIGRIPDYARAYRVNDIEFFGLAVLITSYQEFWESLSRVFYARLDEAGLAGLVRAVRERFVRELVEAVEIAERSPQPKGGGGGKRKAKAGKSSGAAGPEPAQGDLLDL